MDPVIVQVRKTSSIALFPEQLGPGSTLYDIAVCEDVYLPPHTLKYVDVYLGLTINNQHTHIRFTHPVQDHVPEFMTLSTVADLYTTHILIPVMPVNGSALIESGTTIATMEIIAPGGNFILQQLDYISPNHSPSTHLQSYPSIDDNEDELSSSSSETDES